MLCDWDLKVSVTFKSLDPSFMPRVKSDTMPSMKIAILHKIVFKLIYTKLLEKSSYSAESTARTSDCQPCKESKTFVKVVTCSKESEH